MAKRYAILTASGFLYGFDTTKDCGIYVGRGHAATWPTKDRAERALKKYRLIGEVVNLD